MRNGTVPGREGFQKAHWPNRSFPARIEPGLSLAAVPCGGPLHRSQTRSIHGRPRDCHRCPSLGAWSSTRSPLTHLLHERVIGSACPRYSRPLRVTAGRGEPDQPQASLSPHQPPAPPEPMLPIAERPRSRESRGGRKPAGVAAGDAPHRWSSSDGCLKLTRS